MSRKRVIWKWQLESPGVPFTLELPKDYRFVRVSLDGGLVDGEKQPSMWCEVDPDGEKFPVKFLIVATGQTYEGDLFEHLGTIDVQGYFFHLLRERATNS